MLIFQILSRNYNFKGVNQLGSYTEFMIEDMPLVVSKSYAISDIMLIFRESDKKLFQRKISMRSKLVWGNIEDDETEEVFQYECDLQLIKDRLNLFGYNFESIKNKFESIKNEFINERYLLLLEDNSFKPMINELRQLEFYDYFEYLKFYFYNRYNLPKSENYLYNLLNDQISYGDKEIFTFTYDIFEILIIFSEILNSGEKVIQDLTEVKNAGYYKSTDNVVNDCEKELYGSLKVAEQIYIFTEGSSDKVILETSLKLLYPHLYEYFSFVDYQESKLDGGAPMLTKIVKAFIGSRMQNKILAIYDSDTAALESIQSLNKLKLPKNIKFTQYPDINLLKKYPTVGPSGKSHENIYKLAASIELYLGIDCLTCNTSNDLYPVVWTGYNKTLSQYQGEVTEKSKIYENYLNKTKIFNKIEQDWSGLEAIWQHIFALAAEMT